MLPLRAWRPASQHYAGDNRYRIQSSKVPGYVLHRCIDVFIHPFAESASPSRMAFSTNV